MLGYIYKITNQLNNKCYIGQTIQPINERWSEHKRKAKHVNDINTKTYAIHQALSKYGVNNFTFEIIEECQQFILNDKEIYWIDYYDSYNNGYNLTKGGQGRVKYDYDDIIIDLYVNQHLTLGQISKQLNICRSKPGQVLDKYGIAHNAEARTNMKLMTELSLPVLQKSIYCIDKKTNKIIKEFLSITEACKWIQEQHLSQANIKSINGNISATCKGKRLTAFGYKWQYK